MKQGDKVRKVNGYQFDGVIVSVFKNSRNQTRVVVEHNGSQTEKSGGMLHIFSPKQLEIGNSVNDEIKKEAKRWYLKGFEDAETTESQPVSLSQTMKDAETFFELIYRQNDKI